MSRPTVIADTGPLVAFLRAKDSAHQWATAQFARLQAPFLTCEPVLTETFYLVSRHHDGPSQFFDLLASGLLEFDFPILGEHESLAKLIEKYQSLPMSIADACLVRMAELHAESVVLTLDSHFEIYRMHGRAQIPVIAPWA